MGKLGLAAEPPHPFTSGYLEVPIPCLNPPRNLHGTFAKRLTWKGPLGLMGTWACCHTLPLLPLRDQACVSRAPLFLDRTRRLREPMAGEERAW